MPPVRHDSSPRTQTKKTTAAWHDSASYAVVLGVIAFFLVSGFWISLKRLFWFDELMTFQIAGIPKTATFWAALHRGFDGMPVAYYLMERFLLARIHPPELALRLPSLLAVCLGAFVVYDCGRRLTDAFFGLFGMAVVLVSFVVYYSYEARSYGLYFLFAALATWAWCHAGTRLGPVLFGACFFAGMMMHDYFFICLTPYALYEAIRWRPGRLPSAKLIAGIVGIACGILVLFPELLAQRAFNKTFWALPSLALMVNAYGTSLPFGIGVLCLVAAWLALWPRWSNSQEVAEISSAETVGWLHVAIPLAGYFVAKLVTHAFFDRYFIGFVPGLAVALACFCYRRLQPWGIPAFGALVVVLSLGMGDQVRHVVNPASIDPNRHLIDTEQVRTQAVLTEESPINSDGKRYILMSDLVLYSEVRNYSNRPGEYAFLRGSTNPRQAFVALLLTTLGDYVPQQGWTLRDLEQNAARSAVVDMTPEALAALRADGYQTTLAYKIDRGFSHPIEITYLAR